jgi:hypothetical protein
MSCLAIAESFIFSAFEAALQATGLNTRLSAIDTLKIQRDRMMAGLPSRLRIDLISASSRKEWWGNLPAYVIPPVLFLVWTAAYVFAVTSQSSSRAMVRSVESVRLDHRQMILGSGIRQCKEDKELRHCALRLKIALLDPEPRPS